MRWAHTSNGGYVNVERGTHAHVDDERWQAFVTVDDVEYVVGDCTSEHDAKRLLRSLLIGDNAQTK